MSGGYDGHPVSLGTHLCQKHTGRHLVLRRTLFWALYCTTCWCTCWWWDCPQRRRPTSSIDWQPGLDWPLPRRGSYNKHWNMWSRMWGRD